MAGAYQKGLDYERCRTYWGLSNKTNLASRHPFGKDSVQVVIKVI